ncbi:MAG: hypothetical protein QXU32_10245 [Nitrososphaerales archaeon]
MNRRPYTVYFIQVKDVAKVTVSLSWVKDELKAKWSMKIDTVWMQN